MKIRTQEELLDRLDADLAWRTKELSFIFYMVRRASNSMSPIYQRIGITILYAHWEGYIKNASLLYLNYLAQKNLTYRQLNINFVALSLRGQIKTCGNTDKTSIHIELLKELFEDTTVANIPYEKDEDAIKTRSNLNWENFEEILNTLGLDKSYYILNENKISESLVKTRNNVAHGQYITIDKDELLDLYKEVMMMISFYKEQIMECVKEQSYLKINPN